VTRKCDEITFLPPVMWDSKNAAIKLFISTLHPLTLGTHKGFFQCAAFLFLSNCLKRTQTQTSHVLSA